MRKQINILGVKVDNVSEKEAVKKVKSFLQDSSRHYLVTPNPEMIVLAQKDKKFREVLNRADLSVPDGVGLLWAAKILQKKSRGKSHILSLEERVTGADLVVDLCRLAAEEGFRVGFLGGEGDVAKRAAECLRGMFPGLKVSLELAGYPKASSDGRTRQLIDTALRSYSELQMVKNKIAVSYKQSAKLLQQIDFLFVAYGAPRQEYWIARNLSKIPVKVAMGVGGAFDYFGGGVGRAPKMVQGFGLEWLYRLMRQPWRIRRQLALPQFVFMVFKQKFTG